MVLAAVATVAMIHGHFFAGPVTARADGKDGPRRVVTGTQTLTAGQVFVILEPEPGKVFVGHITAGGPGTAANTYDLQVTFEGATTHITGGPTAVAATRDQNVSFVGESLQIYNFGSASTVRFAVAFNRLEREE
jgi:hypothetical protein